MRIFPSLTVVFVGLVSSPAIHAKDVLGNNTAWTNNDSIIWELQGKYRRDSQALNYSGPPQVTWQQQIATRLAQQAEQKRAQEEAARLDARIAARAQRDTTDESAYRGGGGTIALSPAATLENAALHGGFDEAYRAADFFVRTNDPRAIRWLEVCANAPESKTSHEATWWLVHSSLDAGPLHDDARGVRYLRKLAECGDSQALIRLARIVIAGERGVPADPAGMALLERATHATDNPDNPHRAAWFLSFYHRGTPGIPADPAKQLFWLREAVRLAPEARALELKYELSGLLMTEASGWSKHHEEILKLLRQSSPREPEAALLYARLLSGSIRNLEPAAPPDLVQAREALRGHMIEGKVSAEAVALFTDLCTRRGPSEDIAAASAFLVHSWGTDGAISANASCRAADLYAQGGGNLKADPAQARHLYRRAMESPKHKSEASAALARLLIRSREAADRTQAIALLNQVIAAGDDPSSAAAARYELALSHLAGNGVPRDVSRALQLLEDACRQRRDPQTFPAAALLGKIHAEGFLVGADQQKARRFLDEPSLGGYAPAAFEYGLLLYRWKQQPLEKQETFSAYSRVKQAAQAGHADARLLLARFDLEGFGREAADPDAALAIYESGDQAGNSSASFALASVSLDAKSKHHNPSAGFAAAQRAASAGSASGLNLVGMCHLRGWGTPQDSLEALRWFEQAAAKGLWIGGRNAAKLLCLGENDVPKDLPKARTLLETASRNAAPADQREVGRLYLGKDFLPADLERARYWLTQAADRGDADATVLLSDLQRSSPSNTAESDWLKSIERLRQSAAKGDVDAAISVVRALYQDTRYPASDGFKLNSYFLSGHTLEDPALQDRASEISQAITALENLLDDRKDPARSYQVALLLLNEPNTIGPGFGLTWFSDLLMARAAEAGNHDAGFRVAMNELTRGRAYRAMPEEDNASIPRFGIRFSDSHFASALTELRRGAAAGEPKASAFLNRHDLPLTGPEKHDQASIDKLVAVLPGD